MGHKYLSQELKQSLIRKTPRKVRGYKNEFVFKYKHLIESFTREDFLLYEKMNKICAGGLGRTKEYFLSQCVQRGITGPVLEMAKIKSEDLYAHQKLRQVVRHRWTDMIVYKKKIVNENPDKFWTHMARYIQKRCKDDNFELYSDWQGPEGIPVLVEFLKNLYEKQKHQCAISNENMILEIGSKDKKQNKASPDRKNSNKGYTPDNIWLVTWWVNNMKMDMSLITFWSRIRTLYTARYPITTLMDNHAT